MPFTDCSRVEQNSLNVAGFRRATDFHHCLVKRAKLVSFLHTSCCVWFEEQFFKIIQTDNTQLKSFTKTISADLSRRFRMGFGADSINAVGPAWVPVIKILNFLMRHCDCLFMSTSEVWLMISRKEAKQNHPKKYLHWPCF